MSQRRRVKMQRPFSERQGLAPSEPAITIRNDAPDTFRRFVVQLWLETGIEQSQFKRIVGHILPPDNELVEWRRQRDRLGLDYSPLLRCDWPLIYDIIEVMHQHIADAYGWNADGDTQFTNQINRYMRINGIGWELKNGQVISRGPDDYQQAVIAAEANAERVSMPDSANEIREATRDLSKRPTADTTGAISHATVAVESVVREMLGRRKGTLGQLIPELDLPKPLDQAIEKLWGFASDRARHIKEGQPPTFEDAQFVVHIASATVTYLLAKRDSRPSPNATP